MASSSPGFAWRNDDSSHVFADVIRVFSSPLVQLNAHHNRKDAKNAKLTPGTHLFLPVADRSVWLRESPALA